ncbi:MULTISPECIES: maleylacetoacetate isomerase [unclassified Undibacterium]|uniref:maleylacetoacetate isomerase n=1 Tax=unclassified Undibacterium TaxID=2630295 RepID=UPI002AC9E57E|nr:MULTISPECIES: maleylacetoacetate isomerase [unclassified Undibacterium]MEB0139199.1 maleylacetoacetate isomerase [Undibacterium sp. CCC2.1]MEB0172226.1 maleylacetoacetate isomerase [Undibacterium sp. CCC1.1]MEB0175917.1 maleylacetoacetate isomerase [Undibacterium sp. CCC3.4]MEB0215223.1 maleylacetoacetate isomerase [Undibacterium sp. 5I2]WPX43521.1 maleylacetoacetate isomerase [Undibacterium sp. CCC3.4]
MKLYSYFRSSASYRVRIALNLKGLDYQQLAVHLVKNGGEQLSAAYRALNPEALVPTLIDTHDGDELLLTQSLAILEYLDEVYPSPALLPADPAARAAVRSFALSIACEIHPLNNLRVLRYLSHSLGVSEEQKNAWYRHWCETGLLILEQKLQQQGSTSTYCFGEQPGLADCFLIPQIANAERFNCDFSGIPGLMRINQACLAHPAFVRAAPANQADAQ